jgi:hypothetical protein
MNATEKLQNAADEAYKLHPKSCSHAVWYVMKQYIPDQAYAQANALLLQLACDPRWLQVNRDGIEKAVNEGALIVGGLADKPNGHVIAVYPGKAKAPGGYFYKSKKTGKMMHLVKLGSYPLAMSTSIGSWPGAVSNGDKTIWDPWADDDKFAEVKFWRFDATITKKPSGC